MWMMITYKVKPDHLERQLALHHEVYKALEESQLPGLREVTFQLEDKVSFVSLIEADTMPVPGTAELEAFQAYRVGLDDRCEEPATMRVLQGSGSYRFS
jgi:hypothetical protein